MLFKHMGTFRYLFIRKETRRKQKIVQFEQQRLAKSIPEGQNVG